MYMQWSKDDGYTSSFWKLIIPRLLRFEKLDLSQFKLYIETETTTQCFVWFVYQKTILIRSTEGKEKFFCILHMLRIHYGLRKLIKTDVYDFHIKKRIYLISVNHALILQKMNCYLNNIEWILTGKTLYWGLRWWCNKV